MAYTNINGSPLPIPKSRQQQEEEERIVGEWLEDKFYRKYTTAYQHIKQKEFQWAGLDCIVMSGSTMMTIDEKAALSYVGSTLKSFALEVCATGKGGDDNLFFGGFMEDKASDFLVLVYIDDGEDYITRKEDIRKATVILISKRVLRDYLLKLGWTKENIYNKAYDIFKAGYDYPKNDLGDLRQNGWRFNYYKGEFKNGKIEKSVSLLLPKDKLIELSIKSVELV